MMYDTHTRTKLVWLLPDQDYATVC